MPRLRFGRRGKKITEGPARISWKKKSKMRDARRLLLREIIREREFRALGRAFVRTHTVYRVILAPDRAVFPFSTVCLAKLRRLRRRFCSVRRSCVISFDGIRVRLPLSRQPIESTSASYILEVLSMNSRPSIYRAASKTMCTGARVRGS